MSQIKCKKTTRTEIYHQNKKNMDDKLSEKGLLEIRETIYHYTSETTIPNRREYGIIVDEDKYNNYQYYMGYSRYEDDSEQSGYGTKILGFAYKSDLTYFPPDRISPNPTYRVLSSDKSKFRDNIDELYNHLIMTQTLRNLSRKTNQEPDGRESSSYLPLSLPFRQ